LPKGAADWNYILVEFKPFNVGLQMPSAKLAKARLICEYHGKQHSSISSVVWFQLCMELILKHRNITHSLVEGDDRNRGEGEFPDATQHLRNRQVCKRVRLKRGTSIACLMGASA
jgi:hypothetical protein